MLDTIYNFLFTPIMSHNFMNLVYGVKPISIFTIVFIACIMVISLIIVLNKLDKNKYYKEMFDCSLKPDKNKHLDIFRYASGPKDVNGVPLSALDNDNPTSPYFFEDIHHNFKP